MDYNPSLIGEPSWEDATIAEIIIRGSSNDIPARILIEFFALDG